MLRMKQEQCNFTPRDNCYKLPSSLYFSLVTTIVMMDFDFDVDLQKGTQQTILLEIMTN